MQQSPPKKDTILFVCTANICRSPMAEQLLRHALAAEKGPLRTLNVASAGVAAWGGEPATHHSVTALKKVHVDLSHHKSQELTQELLDHCFAVFCMTYGHVSMVEYTFDRQPPYVYLMRQLIPDIDSSTLEIPDPYGRSLSAYEACRDEMIEAIPSILQFLRANYK